MARMPLRDMPADMHPLTATPAFITSRTRRRLPTSLAWWRHHAEVVQDRQIGNADIIPPANAVPTVCGRRTCHDLHDRHHKRTIPTRHSRLWRITERLCTSITPSGPRLPAKTAL